MNCEPIRVAQIMGKLWAGGVESVVFNYYRELDKNIVQFDFFYDADSTVAPPQDLIDMGARFYEIPPYQQLKDYLYTLRKYFRENQYQIVHSHINSLSVFPLYAAKKEGIPIRVAHNHSVPGGNEWKRNVLKNFLKRFSKKYATDFFACSEKAGRWLFGDTIYDEGKVFVLKNAVDFNRFNPEHAVVQLYKQKYGLVDKFVVGHVGRFTYAKNHELLLKIFTHLSQKRPDARLLLVGDGELHEQIESMISAYGVTEKVIMTGQVSDPAVFYRMMDVLVLPSHYEGLSLTTVEAQVAGIPVVISEAVPFEAIIGNGSKYVSLTDSIENWVKSTVEMAGKHVELDERANLYDITKSAPMLANWYIKRLNCDKAKG